MKIDYDTSGNELFGVRFVTESELDREILARLLEGNMFQNHPNLIIDGEDYGFLRFEGKPIIVKSTVERLSVSREEVV